MDWSLGHFRFHPDGEVAMVYDWDSLRFTQEVRVVGSAAATFSVRLDPVPTETPDPEEARAFVGSYEAARGGPFSGEELRAISAAALYATAYGARCEHSLQDPGEPGIFRRRLRQLPEAGYFPV